MSLEELRDLGFLLNNDIVSIEYQIKEAKDPEDKWLNAANRALRYKQNTVNRLNKLASTLEQETPNKKIKSALDLMWDYADVDNPEQLHWLIDQVAIALLDDDEKYRRYITAWGDGDPTLWPVGFEPE